MELFSQKEKSIFYLSLQFSLWIMCVYFLSVLLFELLKSDGLYLIL